MVPFFFGVGGNGLWQVQRRTVSMTTLKFRQNLILFTEVNEKLIYLCYLSNLSIELYNKLILPVYLQCEMKRI